MPIRSHRFFCPIAVVIAFVFAGCKEQSSAPQTSPSPAAATASSPATTNGNAAPATNTTASSSVKGAIDACTLLTGDEIKSVQGDILKDVTPSPPSSGAFVTSQCFYATNNFVNSVSLTVTQQSSSAGAQDLRRFWKERFASAQGREKERERERDRDKKANAAEEEEEGAPPERVKGVGDEAYAIGNAKIGALYVLKGDKFLRISIGGTHNQPKRIAKMKTLAQYAIKRL